MKKFFAFVLFALVTVVAFSQSNRQDVVYLKNGSIIRGIIIEQVPNKSIKIETADRNVFVFQMDEIEKLTKEASKVEVPSKEKSSSSVKNKGLQRGYKGILESGLGVDTYYGTGMLKLNYINGIQFNPYFSVGIGTGLRIYGDEALIPVYADFRVNLLDKKVSPYIASGVGYSFSPTYGGGGLFLDQSVGVSFKVSKKSAMNVGLVYETHDIVYDYEYYGGDIFSSIAINVGFSF